MNRHIHLNLFIHGRGHHEAAWRHPDSSKLPLTDIRYYTDLAQKAEAGLFDSVFLADSLTVGEDVASAPRSWLEPLTTLAALAGATSRIGLIGTCSTTYTEPFNLARQFASIDHISGGRVGWNIVTTWAAGASGNYSSQAPLSHAERYARAEDYMQAVIGLWDSWSDDAVLDNRGSGAYARLDGIRVPNHAGPYYQVKGPLNMPRGPQGRPVFVQAGSSETGRAFAARYAEAVFTAQMEKATAKDFYADLKRLIGLEGRDPAKVLVLPGISPVIGGTEQAAQRIARDLNDLTDPEVGRARLSGRFGGHDFSHLPLDRPLSADDFPDPATVEASRSRTEVIVGLVRREQLTLRQLLSYLAGARGHYVTTGTPEQISDLMEDWFRDGAADGFNLMPPVLPSMLETFIQQVVPILQRRGLFRTEYSGTTLRDQYGLPRPGLNFHAAPHERLSSGAST
jgi:FMN-dependent oxidoreductase (nitrilotriacetate monooxygenase family)